MQIERRSLDYGDPRAMPGDCMPAPHTLEVSQGLADRVWERARNLCERCGRRHPAVVTSSSRDPNHVLAVCDSCCQTF